jgi:NAD(P)-dependent dehydrogenase (short-subunit alcohol dehydrogenase family)
MVTAFAGAGYAVMAAGRDPERLRAVCGERGNVQPWCGDLATSEACERLAADAAANLGDIDLLVNNAGILFRGTALDTTDEAWFDTMAVNLNAVFFLSRACLPHLLRRRGAIINIASDWGLQAGERAVAYCASKGAVVQLTRAMAVDHARDGLRVNAICPGDVHTPMLIQEAIESGGDVAAALRECDQASPTGRVTTAAEVAALALFLAGEDARQITGAAIPVDGGNTA